MAELGATDLISFGGPTLAEATFPAGAVVMSEEGAAGAEDEKPIVAGAITAPGFIMVTGTGEFEWTEFAGSTRGLALREAVGAAIAVDNDGGTETGKGLERTGTELVGGV